MYTHPLMSETASPMDHPVEPGDDEGRWRAAERSERVPARNGSPTSPPSCHGLTVASIGGACPLFPTPRHATARPWHPLAVLRSQASQGEPRRGPGSCLGLNRAFRARGERLIALSRRRRPARFQAARIRQAGDAVTDREGNGRFSRCSSTRRAKSLVTPAQIVPCLRDAAMSIHSPATPRAQWITRSSRVMTRTGGGRLAATDIGARRNAVPALPSSCHGSTVASIGGSPSQALVPGQPRPASCSALMSKPVSRLDHPVEPGDDEARVGAFPISASDRPASPSPSSPGSDRAIHYAVQPTRQARYAPAGTTGTRCPNADHNRYRGRKPRATN